MLLLSNLVKCPKQYQNKQKFQIFIYWCQNQMFSMILSVVIRLSSNRFLLSSDLISVACTFPFSTSLWLCELNSHLLLLVFSYPVVWGVLRFGVFLTCGIVPFLPYWGLNPSPCLWTLLQKSIDEGNHAFYQLMKSWLLASPYILF